MMKSLLKKILSPKIFAVIQKTIDKICSLVFRILPLKNRALFFTVRADGKLLDNAQAVYDAFDGEKFVFAKMYPHSAKMRVQVIKLLLTSKVIVTDDYLSYLRFVKLRKQQKVLQIWHACGAFKKFGLDAESPLTEAQERASHSQYSAVAVTSEKCREYYANAFGISKEICLPIGLPRTDMLFTKADELKASVFANHPDFEGKKIYLFAPTFREKNKERIVYDTKIDWNKLSSLLAEDEIFIIRRHPVMKYNLINKEYNNIIDLSQESTLALTAASAVLITDYSSVIYDATLLGVPCVFYCPDIEEYNRGFYLDFPEDLPGETVTEPEKLLDAIRRAKENLPVDRIEKFKNEQMSACDGHAAERAADIIRNWLK
ncbi:MAG: CDP-glycerol glycerophosphotransferase family protein [Clostridia bacterium]|nr:CDP-glycerol glycerophosphotransferase family protein [Clostridia bacterium]